MPGHTHAHGVGAETLLQALPAQEALPAPAWQAALPIPSCIVPAPLLPLLAGTCQAPFPKHTPCPETPRMGTGCLAGITQLCKITLTLPQPRFLVSAELMILVVLVLPEHWVL